MRPAPHPIAIRFEHVVEAETHLLVEERSNIFGPSDFLALLDDGTTVFSAHGKGAIFGKKREIRDESGLPIFELYASSTSIQGAWYLELPGRSRERILKIDLHGGTGGSISLDVHFVNRYAHDRASSDTSARDELTLTDAVLEIKGQDMERISFDVFYLGAKIANIRRLVPAMASSTRSGGKPLWEASVSANVDLSIVSARCAGTYQKNSQLIGPDNCEHHCSGRHTVAATLLSGSFGRSRWCCSGMKLRGHRMRFSSRLVLQVCTLVASGGERNCRARFIKVFGPGRSQSTRFGTISNLALMRQTSQSLQTSIELTP